MKYVICSYVEVLGKTDFFTAEVLTLKGLVTYYWHGEGNHHGKEYLILFPGRKEQGIEK